jgi:HAD superfamily hydrolase (TIGR01549 family)
MNDFHAPVRAVVFDLDGTLVNSMPMVLRAFAHALEPYRPPMTALELFGRLGGPPDRTFRELIGDDAHVPAALARMAAYSDANWREIRPFDGAHGLLGELGAGGRELAVWTGRDRETTVRILDEHGFVTRFREVVCGDDLPTHKPHPQGLQEIMTRLRVTSPETLYVGDGDVDVLAGAELGVRTILIRHDREIDDAIVRKAWRVANGPAEAYALVRAALAG